MAVTEEIKFGAFIPAVNPKAAGTLPDRSQTSAYPLCGLKMGRGSFKCLVPLNWGRFVFGLI